MIELLLGVIFFALFVAAFVYFVPIERNRDEKGRFVADDLKTWWKNEAWRRKN